MVVEVGGTVCKWLIAMQLTSSTLIDEVTMLLGGYWGYTSKMWLKHFGSMYSIEKSSMYRLDEDLKIHFFQYLQSIYGNR